MLLDLLELDEPMFGQLWVGLADDGFFVAINGAELTAGAAGLLAVTGRPVDFVAAAVFVAAWMAGCVTLAGCAPATAAPMPAVAPTKARPAMAAPIACFRIVLSFCRHTECRP